MKVFGPGGDHEAGKNERRAGKHRQEEADQAGDNEQYGDAAKKLGLFPFKRADAVAEGD